MNNLSSGTSPKMKPLAPRSLQIEASSTCQLACPACPTADGSTRPLLGRGHLKVDDFETLLDRNPELLQIELSNYGEMFLNPQLPRILEAAHSRGVIVSGNNGVNLNFASEEALEAVVRYRVRGLTCSIDGATAETYARYRRNGDLTKVLANIDRILEHKRRYDTVFPILFWQFVVFGHNEHELEMARSMAAERGMHFVPRISWDSDLSPVQNSGLVSIQTGLGAATRDDFRETHGRDYTRDICYQLWQAPVANWDGKVLGCCVNYWAEFGGNLFTDGVAASANSTKMQQARAMLTGHSSAIPGVPCTTCDQYLSLRDSKRWITEAEVESSAKESFLVSLRPSGMQGMKFAKIAIFQRVTSGGQPPRTETAGRLFRFQKDRAVLATLPGPGEYFARAEVITPIGFQTYTFPFTAADRPLCQEFPLPFQLTQPASPDDGNTGQRLNSWII
jgi:MoaA/NifB/PqqE/SkfB family radical SAM enzyme